MPAHRSPGRGLTLIRGLKLYTAGATDDRVMRLDQAQYDANEGPCVDAATDTRTVWSGDLRADARWPTWGPQAAAAGYGSILSTELHAGGRRVGALNLYGEANATFDVDTAVLAHEFARHAAVALAHSRQIEDLGTAMQTRNLIGQAQGILMCRHQIDADRAFAVLRRYSQDSNRKVSDVAAELIGSSARPAATVPSTPRGPTPI